jgi:histone deacetylase 1/2
MEDMNGAEYLSKIKNSVIENIRRTADASVQMSDIPGAPHNLTDDAEDEAMDDDDDKNPDKRVTLSRADRRIARADEFEDSDNDEPDFDKNGDVIKTPSKRQRGRITDFPNPNAADPGAEDGDIVMSGANGRHDADDEDEDAAMEDAEAEDKNEAPSGASGSPGSQAADDEVANNADVEDGMDLDDEVEDDKEDAAAATGSASESVAEKNEAATELEAEESLTTAAPETTEADPTATSDISKDLNTDQIGTGAEKSAGGDAKESSVEPKKEDDAAPETEASDTKAADA